MIVTGPNGCGKSTLLDALRQSPGPSGPILYVGPHRTSGRQRVRMRYLAAQRLLMRQIQSDTSLPNFEGINIHTRARSAWDFDETSNYLKFALCQIELDRQAAVTERFDKHKRIEKDSMPDVWKPLKEMTENLLPHLKFSKIDVSNRDQIQCLWNVHSRSIEVDIDDLSSGEKAIVQLFFPLIENRIQRLLQEARGIEDSANEGNVTEQVCVLMDEPDLHLHPNLQGKILHYLRRLSTRDHIQFIIATHSPTIVELASSDELFLLRPSELVGQNENQLTRIATNDEKLELVREVFGSTSNITAMRTILVVEGRKADRISSKASDERILSFLSDRFSQLTILSGGGKDQCKILAKSLSQILSEELSSRVSAVALVDRDLETNNAEDSQVEYLPVSMIENLLVDPEIIWNAMTAVRHKMEFRDPSGVEVALDELLNDLRGSEIDRRIKRGVGYFSFRLCDPTSTALEQAMSHIQEVQEAVSESAIAELRSDAEEQLESLRIQLKRREHFDGKKILNEFYGRHLHRSGMSKEIFIYECARAAADRKSVKRFVEELFDKIEDIGDM